MGKGEGGIMLFPRVASRETTLRETVTDVLGGSRIY